MTVLDGIRLGIGIPIGLLVVVLVGSVLTGAWMGVADRIKKERRKDETAE